MATFVFNKLIRDKLKAEYEKMRQVATYRKSPEIYEELGRNSPRVSHKELTTPVLALGKYQHYKGDFYEVVGVGLDTETLIPCVIYKPLYESPVKIWVRPLDMFTGTTEYEGRTVERFKKVDD